MNPQEVKKILNRLIANDNKHVRLQINLHHLFVLM